MNAIVPAAGSALVPQTFDQAMRFADMVSRSKMVPKHFQNKPEECLVIIEQAMRWEMSPYAVIQCASMIHDKPMYEGKLVAAVVNSRGPRFGLQGRLRYAYAGDGDSREITVSGVLDGHEETVSVKLKDARTTQEIWKKQPDQQLAYHGARVWARRHMPELMLGVYSPEEFDAPEKPADTFSGTTIEAKAEQPTMSQQIGDALPAHSGGPKRTMADAIRELEVEFLAADTREEVDAVLAGDKCQKALDHARNGAREMLDRIIKTALDRTTPIENAPENEAHDPGADPAVEDFMRRVPTMPWTTFHRLDSNAAHKVWLRSLAPEDYARVEKAMADRIAAQVSA